ncbi:MAG: efflux RND transporter permease subunit, partial [Dehalococcoidia bacterium]|nr:efflux RND transporter permease subunit [Dehalococcoidia bacterium]
VIFLPVSLLSGITGGIFRQFALVIVAAVLTSLFISFTLTPMLASRWLNRRSLVVQKPPMTVFSVAWRVLAVIGLAALLVTAIVSNWGLYPTLTILFVGFLAIWVMFLGAVIVPLWDKGFDAMERVYRRVLRWSLQPWTRWIPPVAAAASLVFALWLVAAGIVRSEFIPQTDNGVILLTTELPPGSSLAATRALHERIEQVLQATPEVAAVLAIAGGGVEGGTTGPRFGAIIVNLKPLKERTRSSFELSEAIRAQVDGLNGASVRVGTLGFGAGAPVAVRVQGQDRDQVAAVAARVEQIVRGIPGTQSVQNTAAVGSPEVRLVVDRQRAADFRVTADQVANALRTTVEGVTVGKFRPEGRTEMDIRLIANEATRRDTALVLETPITVLRDGLP